MPARLRDRKAARMLLSLFRPPRPPQPQPIPPDLIHILAALRQDVADIADAVTGLRDGLAHLHRGIHHLRGDIMATKDEVLAQIADVKAVLVETGKDVGRVADKLDQAVADNDLTAVSAAVDELRGMAQAIDDRAEASVPEPTTDDSAPTSPQA